MKYKQGQFIVWLDYYKKLMFTEIIEIRELNRLVLKDIGTNEEWYYNGLNIEFLNIIDIVNHKPDIKDYPEVFV